MGAPLIDLTTPEFGDLYDELPLWSAPFGLMLLDRVPLRPGQVIVDVGAGTGFLSIELAQRSLASRVYAVDPWGAACARLKRKLALAGLTNVEVLEQDAASMGLPGASVDLVVSNLGLNNFENAGAVLAECFRVLRPGGSLLLSTNLVGHMAEFYDALRRMLPADRMALLEAHVNHRATVTKVQAQLSAAGFEAGLVTQSSSPMRFANGEALLRHWFVRFGFLPAWLEVAGSMEVLDQAASLLPGELTLTIPMAVIEGKKS